jgi:hypothetical protein
MSIDGKTGQPVRDGISPIETILGLYGGDVGAALTAIFAGRPGGDVRPGDGATLEIWRAPVGAGAITRTLDPWDGAAPGGEGFDGANPLAPWILTDGSEHDAAITSPFGASSEPVRDRGWVSEGPTVIVLPTYHYDPSKKDGHLDDPDGSCPDEIVFDDEEGEVFTPDDNEPTEIVFEDDEGIVITPGGDERREDGASVSAPDLLGIVQGLLSGGVAFAGGIDAGLGERLLGEKGSVAEAFVFKLSGEAPVGDVGAFAEGLAGFAPTAATEALKKSFFEASARGDLDGVAVLVVADADSASWAAVDFDDWL